MVESMRDEEYGSARSPHRAVSRALASSAMYAASVWALLSAAEAPPVLANIPSAPKQKTLLLFVDEDDDLHPDDYADFFLASDLMERGLHPEEIRALPALKELLDPLKNPDLKSAEAAVRAIARLSKDSPEAARVYRRQCLLNPRFVLEDVIHWTGLSAGAKHHEAVRTDKLLRKALHRGTLRGEHLDLFQKTVAAMRRLDGGFGGAEEIHFLMKNIAQVRITLNEKEKAVVLPVEEAVVGMDFFMRKITADSDEVLETLKHYMAHGSFRQTAYAHGAYARVAKHTPENTALLSKCFQTENCETASVLVDVCSQCPGWRKMLLKDILANVPRSYSETQAKAAKAIMNDVEDKKVHDALRQYLPEQKRRIPMPLFPYGDTPKSHSPIEIRSCRRGNTAWRRLR